MIILSEKERMFHLSNLFQLLCAHSDHFAWENDRSLHKTELKINSSVQGYKHTHAFIHSTLASPCMHTYVIVLFGRHWLLWSENCDMRVVVENSGGKSQRMIYYHCMVGYYNSPVSSIGRLHVATHSLQMNFPRKENFPRNANSLSWRPFILQVLLSTRQSHIRTIFIVFYLRSENNCGFPQCPTGYPWAPQTTRCNMMFPIGLWAPGVVVQEGTWNSIWPIENFHHPIRFPTDFLVQLRSYSSHSTSQHFQLQVCRPNQRLLPTPRKNAEEFQVKGRRMQSLLFTFCRPTKTQLLYRIDRLNWDCHHGLPT